MNFISFLSYFLLFTYSFYSVFAFFSLLKYLLIFNEKVYTVSVTLNMVTSVLPSSGVANSLFLDMFYYWTHFVNLALVHSLFWEFKTFVNFS